MRYFQGDLSVAHTWPFFAEIMQMLVKTTTCSWFCGLFPPQTVTVTQHASWIKYVGSMELMLYSLLAFVVTSPQRCDAKSTWRAGSDFQLGKQPNKLSLWRCFATLIDPTEKPGWSSGNTIKEAPRAERLWLMSSSQVRVHNLNLKAASKLAQYGLSSISAMAALDFRPSISTLNTRIRWLQNKKKLSG